MPSDVRRYEKKADEMTARDSVTESVLDAIATLPNNPRTRIHRRPSMPADDHDPECRAVFAIGTRCRCLEDGEGDATSWHRLEHRRIRDQENLRKSPRVPIVLAALPQPFCPPSTTIASKPSSPLTPSATGLPRLSVL